MLNITCIKCDAELTQPGALIFSYPDSNEMVFKYHVCQSCWHSHLLNWLDDDLVSREDAENLAQALEELVNSRYCPLAQETLTTYRQKYPKEEKK